MALNKTYHYFSVSLYSFPSFGLEITYNVRTHVSYITSKKIDVYNNFLLFLQWQILDSSVAQKSCESLLRLTDHNLLNNTVAAKPTMQDSKTPPIYIIRTILCQDFLEIKNTAVIFDQNLNTHILLIRAETAVEECANHKFRNKYYGSGRLYLLTINQSLCFDFGHIQIPSFIMKRKVRSILF